MSLRMHKIEESSSRINKCQHHEVYDIIRDLHFLPPNYVVKWKDCTYKDFPFKVVQDIGVRDLQIYKGKALYEIQKRESCH